MKNKSPGILVKSFLPFFILAGILIFTFPRLANAQPQNIQFEHLTTDEGLSHSNVLCILQDHFGYLWFGTFDGLCKYDGYEFMYYRYIDKDPNTIPDNIVRSLYEDHDGNLWIGTDEGLCLYNRNEDKFIRCNKKNGYPMDINFYIQTIFRDSQNKLWFGANGAGAFEYDPESNQCTQYFHHENNPNSISTNFINQIFEDSKGNLWFAANELDLFNRKIKTFTHYRHQENDPNSIGGNGALSIAEDTKGNLWIGCYNAGLSCINLNELDKKIFINYRHDPQNNQSLCHNIVLSLCSDRNGGLWIGTQNGGLDFLQSDSKTFVHYKNDKSDPNSINSNSIYSLCQDKTSDLWIGTYTGGVNVIHHSRQAFKHYKNLPGNPNSLSHNSVWGFDEDHEGNIWIATDGGGLNKFDPKTGNFEYYNSKNTNLNKDAVLTVTVDAKDNIWIGKWDGGVSLFNKQTKSFVTYTRKNSRLSNNNVMDIIEDRKGNLWFATTANANGGGLIKFDKKSKSFTEYTQGKNGLVYNAIEVIKEDSKGDILVGTYQGFSIFDPETEKSINYVHNPQNENSLSNDLITSFFEEDSVTIWITTVNGLNRLNRITNTITRYNKADGLPSSFIFGVEKDDKGFLWISTNGGLSRFNPKTKIFKNYTKEDGLQGNTFIKKSHYRSRDGKLYFGGINGFNVFDPNQVTDNTYIPPVVFTNFKILNKPVLIGQDNSPLKKHISITDELVLSSAQAVFSFDFVALNYTSSLKNQYAFKMEGFDKDWNYVGTRHTATYTNLNPGEYTFRVKGSNNDAVWNEKGTSVRIIITPPFWKTLWFRTFLFLAFVAIAYWIYQWRVQARDLASQKKLDAAVTKERNLLRTLIDNIPDGIYVKDIECRKVIVNPADIHHLGCTSEAEVIGKNDFDTYPKELAEGFFADDQSVIQTGQPVLNKEEYIFDENRQKLWLETSKLPLRDEKGQITGLVGIGRDITERKRAEEALYKSEERFRTITEQTGRLVYDYRLETGVIEWAGAVQDVTGYTPDEHHTLTILDWRNNIHPEDREQAVSILDESNRNAGHYLIEYRYRRKDGEYIYLEDQGIALKNELGKAERVLGAIANITERKRTALERERLIKELQEAIADIKVLSGLVPICSNCKKIRDDQGYWTQLEGYIQAHSEAKFSHGVCPDCMKKLYPNFVPKKTE